MSNEDVEDQDLEELSNEDEIAKKKKKRPSVLCLEVMCYFMIVIFWISYYVLFSIKSLFLHKFTFFCVITSSLCSNL